MASHQWKTRSVRLTEDEENALEILSNKRGKSKHALLKELLLNELGPILKPGKLPQGEGIPIFGEHIFKYNAEKDNFIWQIDLGVDDVHALAEDIPFSFLEKLHYALGKSIENRQKFEEKKSKLETRVPKSILKYKVIKNARS